MVDGVFTKAGNWDAPRSSEMISKRTREDDFRASKAVWAALTETRTNAGSVIAQV